MVRPANIFFKVLTGEGRSLEEDCMQFSIPKGVKNGEWHSFQSELGCMLYKNPLPFYKQGLQIYVAQFDAAVPRVASRPCQSSPGESLSLETSFLTW